MGRPENRPTANYRRRRGAVSWREGRLSKAYGADGRYRRPGSLPVCLPGKLGVPPQLHGGLDRLDTLASFRDGLIERGLEPLIGFDQLRVLIRRGDRQV